MPIRVIFLGAALALCLSTASCSSSSSPSSSGSSNDAGNNAESDAGTSTAKDAGSTGSTGTSFTGTLGALGAAQPTVSSWMITNSGETLIYMSSTPLTCPQIQVSRWLGSTTAGSQVIEIVVKGSPAIGDTAVPPGEVNFAPGGKSSAYETNADSGKITFTKFEKDTVVEGSVSAVYGSDSIQGTFHAEFCANGQGY